MSGIPITKDAPVPRNQSNIQLADAGTFAALYEAKNQIVYRFIYGLHGGPAQAVEDLTAYTFEKAWKARRRFTGTEDAAVGWLLTIARRLVIDAHRKKARRGGTHASLDNIPPLISTHSPERRVETNDQIRILWSLLKDLPEKKREILVLRYMIGWPVNQIADHLNMRENTVSVTIHRTLKELREWWPEQET